MNRKIDIKKQIIILSGVVIIMIFFSILISQKEEIKEISNSNTNETTNNDVTIDGLNKQQVDNMKGLMEDKVYEDYKNYFENGTKSNTTTAEELMIEGENVDFLTEEEQDDLDKDLKEALELYGNDLNT